MSESIFWPACDVEALTGYKVHAKQIEWLTDHHKLFEVARSGRPLVYRDQSQGQRRKPELRVIR